MRESRDIMGMPVSIEVVDADDPRAASEIAFNYFSYVDETFSTYKESSEVSRINRGELAPDDASDDMRAILSLAEETREKSGGYFDIRTPEGALDPSGIVKGWAIQNAAELLRALGYRHFYLDAGGDIQTDGHNREGNPWRLGIRNPFALGEIVKVIEPAGRGVATSGTYLRGKHIYDPHARGAVDTPLASLTVIGPDVYDADRFATAAFAMGEQALPFIESLHGFEAYAIAQDRTQLMTSGFFLYDASN